MAQIAINLKEGKIEKEEIIVGIDLGTTNSLIAIIDKESGNPIALRDDSGYAIVPSIIHFASNGEIVVGNNAKKHLIEEPQNTIYSVKRLMGKSYGDVEGQIFGYKIIDDNTESLLKINVNDKFYTPTELSSLILKQLKARAESVLKKTISKAVITVPAYFNDAQRQATRDAGKLAGLDVLRIINEPTAASLAYGIGISADEEKIIAVYDLGGGTFDISILRIHNQVFEVLSTHGNTYLGGDDFDRLIMEYWLKENNSAIEKLDEHQLQELRLLAEEAKIFLSDNANFSASTSSLKCQISKSTFELLITPLIEKTITSCKQALRDAKLKPTDINAVIMVGGSTRTPFVKETVSTFFGQAVNDTLNPDEVVALGASVQADILAGNQTDMLLLDVTPLSLGLETIGGLMDVIIPRNTKIPFSAGRQYTTSVDGQVQIKIAVYQGERDVVHANRKLGEFILKNIPAMPAGFPKVEIVFQLNADGILTVKAKELRSATEQSIEIKPQYGISEKDMALMLKDSLLHAKEDMNNRALIEARTEAKMLVDTTEKFIVKNKQLMSEEEISETSKLINTLKQNLEYADKDEIYKALDNLNEFTKPFAERIMDMAIADAMKGKKIN
ncbi:MAG: Fe-S protein assembly chaperone HscA [Bacteroidetes bacterium]|nr:Fe-S protein assembly chaperone HscA [Bacteroidota bacterium]